MSDSLEGMSTDQIETLARLAKTLGEKPETRKEWQKLVKRAVPTAHFVELEVDEKVDARLAQIQEENEKFRAELAQRDQRDQRNRLRNKLEKEGLIAGDEDFEKVEEIMVKHGVADHEFAAKHLANERRLAEPVAEVPGRGGPMYMPQEAKQFFKNPTQTSRRLAHLAVDDIIKARRSPGR